MCTCITAYMHVFVMSLIKEVANFVGGKKSEKSPHIITNLYFSHLDHMT